MDLELAGKVALISGGSRGIGLAIAQSLAREKVKLCVAARGKETLAEAVAALRALGTEAHGVAVDLATPAGAEQAVRETITTFGKIDLLVNNTGGSRSAGSFDVATAAQWEDVMGTNLYSAVWCSQHAVAFMKDHGGGCIVHIGSISGREYTSSAPYGAAKAAMIGLAKEMAVDLAKHQIRVNTVAPGSIMFEGGSWDKRRTTHPELIEKMIAQDLPWKRFGRPEEVAELVTFLCSARASWITGACIPVDGGQGRALLAFPRQRARRTAPITTSRRSPSTRASRRRPASRPTSSPRRWSSSLP